MHYSGITNVYRSDQIKHLYGSSWASREFPNKIHSGNVVDVPFLMQVCASPIKALIRTDAKIDNNREKLSSTIV